MQISRGRPSNAKSSAAVTGTVVVDTEGLAPLNVWVVPSSATVSVEYSVDGGNSYSDWPAGDVTAATADTIVYPVSCVRFGLVSGTSYTYGVE